VLFPPDPDGLRRRHSQARAVAQPHHHEAFVASEMSVEDGITPEALLERLRRLQMLRAKGFVRTTQGIQLVQGVGRRLELTAAPVPVPEALLGRVVIITRRHD